MENSFDKPKLNKTENPISQEEEDDERLKAFMEMHPENFPNPDTPKDLREYGPEFLELEAMIKDFKKSFSLEELNSITQIQYKLASQHPLRAPAQELLGSILKNFKKMDNETNAPEEKLQEIYLVIDELSIAVGIIVGDDFVDHARFTPTRFKT